MSRTSRGIFRQLWLLWRQPYCLWALASVFIIGLPWWLSSEVELTLLSQCGVAILCCLAFAFLLGQGGLLSFGHALYFGVGAYTMAWVWPGLQGVGWGSAGVLLVLPMVSGLAALAVGWLVGLVLARHTGAAFAMLTLALGELAWALAQTWPAAFGGEAGLSLNRTAAPLLWGGQWTFASSFQITVLIGIYTALGLGVSAWIGRSSLVLALNAVRDHAQRAQSVGLSPHRARRDALAVSAWFCGVAGGLFALHLEHVSSEVLGSQRSGAMMLFAILGGVSHPLGPVMGGILMVLVMGWLSHFTPAWMIYVGVLFTGVVLWAPQGLAGGLARQATGFKHWGWQRYMLRGGLRCAVAAFATLGGVALIEMSYRWQDRNLLGDDIGVLGYSLNLQTPWHWLLAGLAFATGVWGLRAMHRRWDSA